MDSPSHDPIAALRREMMREFEHVECLAVEREKRYMQRFDAADEAVEAALTAAKEAVNKAEIATEKRFENVNEFRATLADQANTFMPRAEADTRLARIEVDMGVISKAVQNMSGRGTGLKEGWGYLVGAFGIGGGIIGVIVALTAK